MPETVHQNPDLDMVSALYEDQAKPRPDLSLEEALAYQEALTEAGFIREAVYFGSAEHPISIAVREIEDRRPKTWDRHNRLGPVVLESANISIIGIARWVKESHNDDT